MFHVTPYGTTVQDLIALTVNLGKDWPKNTQMWFIVWDVIQNGLMHIYHSLENHSVDIMPQSIRQVEDKGMQIYTLLDTVDTIDTMTNFNFINHLMW